MKQKRLIHSDASERVLNKAEGYTLLELLLVIAITGAIVTVVGASFVQIMKGKVGISQKSVAMADLDSAFHWLSRDLVMAQTTTFTSTSNMTLNWSDKTTWAIDEGVVAHSINYVLSGTRLLRNYDGEVSIISRYLTTANFSVNGQVFTITLTSRPGLPGSAVTRSFKIEERTDPAP